VATLFAKLFALFDCPIEFLQVDFQLHANRHPSDLSCNTMQDNVILF
jgi:hypothetical protein